MATDDDHLGGSVASIAECVYRNVWEEGATEPA